MLQTSMIGSLNFTPVYSTTGMYVWVFLFVVLVAGVGLAVVRSAWRTPIGVVLAALGVLETVPFLLGLSGLIRVTPVSLGLLPAIFVEGIITLVSGVAIFLLRRAKPR